MIKAENIEAILTLYKKHGWNLRRVLLSDALRVSLTEKLQNLFGGAEIVSSKLDAAWFSRISPHGEAWELRNLGDPPFAFVEVLDENADADELNEVLTATEARMLDKKTA
ncbi:MAG TPA: hypothetical protein PKY59_03170 [Pyrinomonadaceae bacterium]|nr:hypothetical protein [Pyrinomonadaceae bacterium]